MIIDNFTGRMKKFIIEEQYENTKEQRHRGKKLHAFVPFNFSASNYKGFTLTEAMVAMVVLGIAAAGVLLPFSSGATVRAEGMRNTLGSRLAGDLVERIVNTQFDQIITTYGSYSETAGNMISDFDTVPKTKFTDPMYANFTRSASCAYVNVPQESRTLPAVFILATVRVNYNGREIARVNRLITK
jgi:prepilin-type N-terminal cleavage/methylation domain-containing protein